VLQLRVFGDAGTIAEVADRLGSVEGARHVIRTNGAGADGGVVTADLGADAADAALAEVRALGVAPDDVELLRLDSIGPQTAQRPLASVVWADLLSQAGANSRPFARYLVLMACAGAIAGFGVIYDNGILVVGAMATSPDLLPITAAGTALVLGRWRLAMRALATLGAGLALAGAVGALLAFLLNTLALLPDGFAIGSSSLLKALSTVNVSTPLVAFAAGVAGMLALETRASSSVGVAISVTTIPASAYLGVAAGVGEIGKAAGALLVLTINVVMLVAAGALVLVVQRRLNEP
jgi:uncharacterized hydrophobic protein (TIGR00271 family)